MDLGGIEGHDHFTLDIAVLSGDVVIDAHGLLGGFLSLFARRSSIVGDIRILCEFLIQLRTRIGLDGGLIF